MEQKKQISELSYIDYEGDNPFNLFKEWWDIAHSTDIIRPSKVCFSTASKNGQVSSRYLGVRRYDETGFVIKSDARSRKFNVLKENPQAAMVFLWSYTQGGRDILRQVRVEGEVKELSRDLVQPMYDDQPLFCKIRDHLCHQGQEVNWNDLKAKHDELVKRVEQGEDLPMPEHVIGLKLLPRTMEFFYSCTNTIADRLYFDKIDKMWVKKRIAA